MDNQIFGPDNKSFAANAPEELLTARSILRGLPLGVTSTGEVGVKVIVIGNATIGIEDLPQNDPGIKGKLWNNNGKVVVSLIDD